MRLTACLPAIGALFALSNFATAASVFMIDVYSTTGGATATEPGWTSINGDGGNGETVAVDGTTFTIFSSDGARNRGAPNPITQDFIFDDGANQAVGLVVGNLPDGVCEASVWSWDNSFPTAVGDQIVGLVDASGETIFTTSFAPSPTDPFTFTFDSSLLTENVGLGGIGIFTRENNGNNRARFNALQLVLVPEPATIAIWSLLGLVGVGLAWRRRRKN